MCEFLNWCFVVILFYVLFDGCFVKFELFDL